MKQVIWYFDFISPFAYLQSEVLINISTNVIFRPKPVLLAGLLKHWNNKGPAEVAPKRLFTYRHVLWLAEKAGVPLHFPPAHPFNPLFPLRLALAIDADIEQTQTIFRFIWAEGRDPSDPAEQAVLAKRVGVSNPEEVVQHPRVKNELRANSEAAIAAGVFGVPTLQVDDQIFWGFDATHMMLDYLKHPAFFEQDEIARLEGLPEGASR